MYCFLVFFNFQETYNQIVLTSNVATVLSVGNSRPGQVGTSLVRQVVVSWHRSVKSASAIRDNCAKLMRMVLCGRQRFANVAKPPITSIPVAARPPNQLRLNLTYWYLSVVVIG